MDPFLARTMIESLSKGIDPLTGRVLPEQDSCAKEDVQEALETVLEHCFIESTEQYLIRIREEKAIAKKERQEEMQLRYPRTKEPWTSREEEQLLSLYERKYNIYKMGDILKRSPGAVAAHLKHMERKTIYRTKRTGRL